MLSASVRVAIAVPCPRALVPAPPPCVHKPFTHRRPPVPGPGPARRDVPAAARGDAGGQTARGSATGYQGAVGPPFQSRQRAIHVVPVEDPDHGVGDHAADLLVTLQ
jgi:hypothetical protein